MQLLDIFPHLNALLNTLSVVLLFTGFFFIKKGEIQKHRASMLSAFVTSTLFLISYISFHSIRTYYFGLKPTKFTGEGIISPIYFFILTTHSILATLMTPFIIITLWLALKGKFETHKKFARYLFPVWVYVSFTGVIVYLLLYHFYPNR